jgi:cytochrome P450
VVVCGAVIRAAQRVLPRTAAATHDDREFEDPALF